MGWNPTIWVVVLALGSAALANSDQDPCKRDLNKLAFVRWTTARDLPAIEKIEISQMNDSREMWDSQSYRDVLKAKNTRALTAVSGASPVGVAVYTLNQDIIQVMRVIVDKDLERQGIGTSLLTTLKTKVTPDGKRKQIRANVSETDLTVLNFLKKNGFKWIETMRGSDAITGEDRYVMQYKPVLGPVPVPTRAQLDYLLRQMFPERPLR